MQSMIISPIPIKNGLKTTNHEISECKITLATNKIIKVTGTTQPPHPKFTFTLSPDNI